MTPRHFAWQAWRKLTSKSSIVLRGRRGANSHLPSFYVAGVALMVLGYVLGLGRAVRDAAALCVAGAVQTHIYRDFCVAGVAQAHIVHRFAWHIHTHIHTYIYTYTHSIFSHTFLLCHTPSFTFHFVTHNCFTLSILHHLLCFSFLPHPRYNL